MGVDFVILFKLSIPEVNHAWLISSRTSYAVMV